MRTETPGICGLSDGDCAFPRKDIAEKQVVRLNAKEALDADFLGGKGGLVERAFSMDAVAVGLIFMVLSSLYMWFELPQKRLLGAVVLGLGSLSRGLFCLGLRWLF